MEDPVAFLAAHVPGPAQILVVGPPSLAWALGALGVSAWLKRARGWPTGYTRKVFHFAIFGAAAGVQSVAGLSALFVFGAATSAVIFFAVWRGDGHPLYEAIAREKDAPRRTAFILAPYLATLIGGLLANALFGAAAIAGYLVTGIADAIAEPVGTRFGRHPYRVPSFGGVPATRSIEGSAAVFAASALALALSEVLVPGSSPTLLALLGVAAACTLVEAVSPHGWDNATLQLAASFLFFASMSCTALVLTV